MKNKEVELILTKLKIVRVSEENGAYICDREHSKLLLSYIEQLEECYCNRTDCIGRIKDSKKYDSLLQKYEQLEKENETLKEIININYEQLNNLRNMNKQLQNNKGYDVIQEFRRILKGDSDDE